MSSQSPPPVTSILDVPEDEQTLLDRDQTSWTMTKPGLTAIRPLPIESRQPPTAIRQPAIAISYTAATPSRTIPHANFVVGPHNSVNTAPTGESRQPTHAMRWLTPAI